MHTAIAAEQSLIVDAVRTALHSRGLSTGRIPWPGGLPAPRTSGDAESGQESRYEVGLLVCDLKDWRQIRASGLVLRSLPIPWAVLTEAAAGPLWGAVYEAGATTVLPAWTSLDEVVTTLIALARGGPGADEEERQHYRTRWRQLRERRAELRTRAEALTPREREVLALLYEGATIVEIAALLQISPATVRSQVKAVRQKLGVTSQLAAVAAYGSLIEQDPALPPVRS